MLIDGRYSDNHYEYRHVQLPKAMLKAIPRDYFDPSKGTLKLLWEEEWRGLGITQVIFLSSASSMSADMVMQSLGWEHYEVHEPEPHILLFKYVLARTGHHSTLLTPCTGDQSIINHHLNSGDEFCDDA